MIIKAQFNSICTRCQGPIAAGETIEWNRTERGAKHALAETCAAFRAQPVRPPVVIDVRGIVEFLGRAAETLKHPKARFLSPANEEMRLSIAGPRSNHPGSVQVKIAGEWWGNIRPDGVVIGPRLPTDVPVLETLKAIQEDPANAARAYGALMCRCSFCNLPLTDEGSVEVGYGPICARNWNLTWERFGVPTLTMIPEVEAREALAQELVAQAQDARLRKLNAEPPGWSRELQAVQAEEMEEEEDERAGS
jgi:hypothetical protein